MANFYQCFFPNFTGKEAEELLRESNIVEGTFLIRNSNSSQGNYTLTAMTADKQIVHTRIYYNGDGYEFNKKHGETFSTLSELVQHYMLNKDHLVTNNGVPLLLRFPYPAWDPTEERWYHGNISGQDAEAILRKNEIKEGSFLVRDSRTEPGSYAFSIKTKTDAVTHVKIYKNHAGRYQLEGPDHTEKVCSFESLDDLVNHYKSYGLVDRSMTLIKFSIPVPTTGVMASKLAPRVRSLDSKKNDRGKVTGYYEEFKQLQEAEALRKNQNRTPLAGKQPDNMAKNRYRNIVPYDESRVKLEPSSGYINASYIPHIDTYYQTENKKTYISTQGPLPSTIGDFWKMIFQERTPVIVMVALCIEAARKKCEMYWPETEPLECSNGIKVYLLQDQQNLVYRTRRLKVVYQDCEHELEHFQFLKWPDFDVPENPGEVLEFLHAVSTYFDDLSLDKRGPIVVHCSAGIGRSGAYIVCDMIYDQIKRLGVGALINIKETVQHCRDHRPGMVQTEGQYMFIYKAINEQVESLQLRS